MLRVVTRIQIAQQTPKDYPVRRNKKFNIDFVNEYEVISAWQNMTDTAKLKLPKNVVIRYKDKRTYPLRDTNKPVGAPVSDIPPVFMKGDRITIDHGYWGYTKEGNEILSMTGEQGQPHLFEGYITGVKSGELFELSCEDHMWKLKQTPAVKKSWSGVTIEKMMEELLQGTGFRLASRNAKSGTAAQVSTSIDWSGGAINTNGESVAKVLDELRKKCHIECYFRGDGLRLGLPVYYEEEARTVSFCFSGKEGNIIDDDLEYRVKEDIVMSAVAQSIGDSAGTTNHRGKAITKTEKTEILITLMNGVFTEVDIPPGGQVPANEEGERLTYPFAANVPRSQMVTITRQKLQQACYTGFYGHFTAFGMPFVRHGDNVRLKDPKHPERDGTYKVKAVTYKGGTDGLRQEIHLDYKLR